ncbi:MAG: glycosyltransferase, partial [Thermoplasmata archaeon]
RPEFANHKHHLELTDLIAICYPKGFFPTPEVIREFKDKILWFGPVLNLPEDEFQLKEADVVRVNILVNRGKETVIPLVHELSRELDFEIIKRQFKSEKDHFSSLARTTIAITQGTNAIFECSHLGIPQVCLPINYEQLTVAKKFEEARALKCIPLEKVTKENLREALGEMVVDRALREKIVERARRFTTPPGTRDIAAAIIETVRG